MSYTTKDFPSKKEIKEALARGEVITCYQPGLGPSLSNWTGSVTIEGPHFPKPHRFYATGMMKNGQLVSIK